MINGLVCLCVQIPLNLLVMLTRIRLTLRRRWQKTSVRMQVFQIKLFVAMNTDTFGCFKGFL